MNGRTLTALSLTAALAAAPAAEVPADAAVPVTAVPLRGEPVSGTLRSLDAAGVTIETGDGPRELPLPTLREVTFGRTPADTVDPVGDAIAVGLTDGSELPAAAFTVTDRRAELAATAGFEATLPVSAVRSVRFRPAPAAAREAWRALGESEPARDLLVIAKGDSLDRVEAAVGTVTAETVSVELRGRTVPLPRTNANFVGVVFARPRFPSDAAGDTAAVRLVGGGTLNAAAVSLEDRSPGDGSPGDGAGLSVTLAAGPELRVPLSAVASIDYSGGKIRYLSEFPTRAESTEDLYRFEGSGPIDPNWEIWRNRNPHGDPIRLGRRDFDRGLCVHSRTELRWRLAGQFRRLRGVVGIEAIRAPRGDADLTIVGDGVELLRRPVVGTEPPFEIDVEVAGVRDLQLIIGFGSDGEALFPGMGDWVGLGDLRVTK